VLFSRVLPEAVHLFGSRTNAFRKDEVLQENVIMRCVRKRLSATAPVTITTSGGITDLGQPHRRIVPLGDVVDVDSRALAVHIPTTDLDDRVLAYVRSWRDTLQTLAMKVSTGPVVAFRAAEFLHDVPNGGVRRAAPLAPACQEDGRALADRRLQQASVHQREAGI
jgi:hypothetical protein